MTLPAEAIESGDRTYYWGALVPNVEKVNGVLALRCTILCSAAKAEFD